MSLWTTKTVVLAAACLGVVGLGAVAGVLSCSNGQGPVQTSIDELGVPAGALESSRTAPAPIHINDILQQWSTGCHEEAVRNLLQLAETQASPASYRPFDLSEEQFTSLPEAERDLLREKMLARFRVLREFTREFVRRMKEAVAEGDDETAKRLLVAIKRLGAANTGPEVTRVAELMGQAIEALADRELAQFEKAGASEGQTP